MLLDERVQNLRALAFIDAVSANLAGRATDAHFTGLFVDMCLAPGLGYRAPDSPPPSGEEACLPKPLQ